MSLSSTNDTDFREEEEKLLTESGKQNHPKCLEFRDIEATSIKKKGVRQEILKGVSGKAKAGELTFIMGSSGAGKTTLLNILTGRNLKKIERDGDILVNGTLITASEIKKISAYVQQDDIFIDKLTVKETLRFSAKLRSPKKLNDDEIDEIVEKLMKEMNLKKCENTLVGSISQKSLSRGERKRLAFACELLTDPQILFCDEPTSGLDSFMSHRVIKALKQLCSQGKTIICTIHQPSTSVFKMADSLILLAQGNIAYQGRAQDIGEFFEKCGYPVPRFVNSADHFMRVLSHGTEEDENVYKNRIDGIIAEYENSKEESTSHSSKREKNNDKVQMKFPRPWILQFLYIFHRSLVVLSRDKFEMIVKFTQIIAMAAVLGSIYFNISIQKSDLLSLKGFAFTTVQLMHLLFMFQTLPLFWKEYPVVIREYQSNMYSPSAYFLAKSMSDMIQYLIFPFIFCSILIWSTNLPRSFWPFFHYYSISLILSLLSTSLSRVVASIVGEISSAVNLLFTITIPFMVFGGFFISYDRIPFYLEPVAAISWHKYAYEGFLIGFMKDVGQIPGCNETSTVFRESCSTGIEFIRQLSFKEDNLWLDYTVLLTVVAILNIAGISAFVWRIRRS